MNGFTVFFLFLLAIAVAVAVFAFGTWIVVWNLTDMAEKGVSFWNVFWILLVGTVLFGGAGAASSNK